jgi:hypothetical protein
MIHQNRRGRQSFVMPRSTPGVKQMVALHHLEDFEKEMRSALQEFRTSLDRGKFQPLSV